MITTIQTTYQGRTYEVVADSDKHDAAFFSYVSIYRIRKNGSRGRRHHAHGEFAWRVWKTVSDQVDQAQGRAPVTASDRCAESLHADTESQQHRAQHGGDGW